MGWAAVLTICAVTPASGAPGYLLADLGWKSLIYGTFAFSWIPLWPAVLLQEPAELPSPQQA
jgi:hypothetical protein